MQKFQPRDDDAVDYNAMWEQIKKLVHGAGIELDEIRGIHLPPEGPGRHSISQLRFQVCYILYNEVGYSQSAIADFLHTTENTVKYRARQWRLQLLRAGVDGSRG